MPKPLEVDYYFSNWKATMSPLFVAYSDSECKLFKDESLATHLGKHTACAIGYIIIPHKDIDRRTLPHNLNYRCKSFVGKNCAVQYLRSLEKVARDAFEWAKVYANKLMICQGWSS